MSNLGLRLKKVPTLWKTSCVVLVPRTAHPREPERLQTCGLHLSPDESGEDHPWLPLHPGGLAAVCVLTWLWGGWCDHLLAALWGRCESHVCWFPQCLQHYQAFAAYEEDRGRRGGSAAGGLDNQRPYQQTTVCEAPQGTMFSLFLFLLDTSDFSNNSEQCHLQQFSDDTTIVGRLSEGNVQENKGVIADFLTPVKQEVVINSSRPSTAHTSRAWTLRWCTLLPAPLALAWGIINAVRSATAGRSSPSPTVISHQTVYHDILVSTQFTSLAISAFIMCNYSPMWNGHAIHAQKGTCDYCICG